MGKYMMFDVDAMRKHFQELAAKLESKDISLCGKYVREIAEREISWQLRRLKMAAIDILVQPEEPSYEDIVAIEAAAAEDPNETITLEEYKKQRGDTNV